MEAGWELVIFDCDGVLVDSDMNTVLNNSLAAIDRVFEVLKYARNVEKDFFEYAKDRVCFFTVFSF
mgnify:CR=1 FL=1